MQVLAGDLESAIRSHLVYWNLWRRYGGLPESWSWQERRIEWAGWPGRPEFIESTYYLFRVSWETFSEGYNSFVLGDKRPILPARRRTGAERSSEENEDKMRLRNAKKCGNRRGQWSMRETGACG
jgi:mannosidase alpha-like ER degradation enhancer 1